MKLTPEEVKTLYEFLAHQYIHYENEAMTALSRKISLYMEEMEIEVSANIVNDERE